jgi:hypothetical protein
MTYYLTMTISDSVLILATLLAPVLAVQVQKYLERRREAEKRRSDVFRIIMATRATRLAPLHVEALNMIDVEFYGRKYKRITDAWRAYRDNLSNIPKDAPEAEMALWHDRNDELFTNLAFEMSVALRYEFDRVHIKRAAYMPVGLGEVDDEFRIIRKALVSILSGKHPIPMSVISFPDMEETEGQKQLQQAVTEYLQKGEPIPVKVISDQSNDKK